MHLGPGRSTATISEGDAVQTLTTTIERNYIMSIRTVIVSDLSGEPEASTTRLGFEGQWHEVDLTVSEKDALEAFLQPYIEAGRCIGSSLVEKKKVVPDTTVEEREEIRAWGREQGYEFADYGRIPKKVYNAYVAAHEKKAS